MNKKHSFFSLFAPLAWVLPVFTITGDDAPGTPSPTPDPTPEPEPAPTPEPAPSDTRSVAAKFIDQLKSKDTLSATNATLKKDLATANARITTLTAENTTLTGAVEASQELLNRLSNVEKTLGLKSGILSSGTETEVNAALTSKIASGVIDAQAQAGVPSAELPAAAPNNVDPNDAKLNTLTGLDRAKAGMRSVFKKLAA